MAAILVFHQILLYQEKASIDLLFQTSQCLEQDTYNIPFRIHLLSLSCKNNLFKELGFNRFHHQSPVFRNLASNNNYSYLQLGSRSHHYSPELTIRFPLLQFTDQ